jgi:hypothetical protein
MNIKIILNKAAPSNHYNGNGTIKTHAPWFKDKADKGPDKPERESDTTKPPSAVSTHGDESTQATRSSLRCF